MTIADRFAANQARHDLFQLLEQLATLKTNKGLYQTIGDFTQETMLLIERGNRGDSEALDRAHSNIRWMEAAYHTAPLNMRRSTPMRSANGDVPRDVQQLLALLQPKEGRRKWLDLFIENVVFVIIGAIGGGVG